MYSFALILFKDFSEVNIIHLILVFFKVEFMTCVLWVTEIQGQEGAVSHTIVTF